VGYWIAGAWLSSGFAFFIATGIHSGWPERWAPVSNREAGWRDHLTFYLPLCLLIGPFLWGGFLLMRLKN
jgi:hypothetical protein